MHTSELLDPLLKVYSISSSLLLTQGLTYYIRRGGLCVIWYGFGRFGCLIESFSSQQHDCGKYQPES